MNNSTENEVYDRINGNKPKWVIDECEIKWQNK